jgi:3-oxoacyl-[acyl-carrier-protein] synthase II
MGLVFVFGNDLDAYYARLLAGESGVGAIDCFDASGFPTRFAAQIRGFSSEGYVDGKLDRRLDDCHRYALVAAKKSLESAGLAPGSNAMDKVRSHHTAYVRKIHQWPIVNVPLTVLCALS